jgi:HEAT repeat protein
VTGAAKAQQFYPMEFGEEAKKARDIVQSVLKAKKILRMYPRNNPIYSNTLQECFDKFREFFYLKDELNLKIRQNEIFYEEEQLYYSAEKEDNLALFFFKDGLREIDFMKGLSLEEMEEFLKIVSLDYHREAVDDDIVTLLWEKDFQDIRYVVDEATLTDEEDDETTTLSTVDEEKEAEQDGLLKAYEDASKEEDDVKDVSIVPLADKDLQLLVTELEKDSIGKAAKLADILFEMFNLAENRADLEELGNFFSGLLEFSLAGGDIRLASDLMSRVKEMAENRTIEEAFRNVARKVILFGGSERVVSLLGEVLDAGQELDERLFEDYVKLLDRNAIVPFMKVLGDLQTIHSRKVVIDALTFLGKKDIVTLAGGLNDSRWYVVRNIIYILRKIGDKRAVDHLLKTVRHGDIRVRQEVIRALGELGGAGVLQALRECLDDPEAQVRSAALKALAGMGSEAAKRIIMNRVSDKNFKDKDFEEKKQHFEALSRWKDSEIYAFLAGILKNKSFFGRAKTDENRACAAYCLGLLGNKDAVGLLNKYKNESSKLLKEYSYTAIKRLEQ